jgi:hypothetical protein
MRSMRYPSPLPPGPNVPNSGSPLPRLHARLPGSPVASATRSIRNWRMPSIGNAARRPAACVGATLVRSRDEEIDWDILADPEGTSSACSPRSHDGRHSRLP